MFRPCTCSISGTVILLLAATLIGHALAANSVASDPSAAELVEAVIAQENKILSPVLPLKPPPDAGHVYELRWYRAHVGRLGEWLGHFKDIMPTREKYSKNVGVFQTEAGQLNEAVHLWAYKDLNDRAAVRGKVLQDPEWQSFLGKSLPCLAEMKSIILNPAAHSPMQ